MNFKELNGLTIEESFNQFNNENSHVYDSFKNQVFKAIRLGKKKISAKALINWIRWNEYMKTEGLSCKKFRINDAYQSYYARLFVKDFPEHKNIFEFRRLRNETKKD